MFGNDFAIVMEYTIQLVGFVQNRDIVFSHMKKCTNLLDKVADPEMLFDAWKEFRRGKASRVDVRAFEVDLEANIFQLSRELLAQTYRHSGYVGFYITDPKRRHIHKASVRDRIVHHAVMKVLNPLFEPTFIANSFSCRVGKGTHKGVVALRTMLRKESRNDTRFCYVLKCDVRKFFDSIDHAILIAIVKKRIKDHGMLWLLEEIIGSFSGERSNLFQKRGVPIGNLTSQIFANIYMNEFDQFVKHHLRVQHYARYTDDFIVVSQDSHYLRKLIVPMNEFLKQQLALDLHPGKVSIGKYHHGADFLGYVVFPHHTLLRKRTLRRMWRNFEGKTREYKRGAITKEAVAASLNSYMGILSHADAFRIREELKNRFWFEVNE